MAVWRSHLQFFTTNAPAGIPKWSDERLEKYFRIVNSVLNHQESQPDVRGWWRWLHTEYDRAALPSEMKTSLMEYHGMGRHISAIAVQDVSETFVISLDLAFAPKADVLDVRFSLMSGEIALERPLNHEITENAVAEVMREAAQCAGVELAAYKLARWAIMRHHVHRGWHRASGPERLRAAREIRGAYPGLFDELAVWNRVRGKYTRITAATDGGPLFDNGQVL